MCAPSKEGKALASDAKPHRGFLLGTISLALAVTAGTVTMGHFNSRRDELGCDAMCVGSMASVRSFLTLLGSTLVGRFSDSHGSFWDRIGGARKVSLVAGILASITEIILSSQGTTILALWMSMIPPALLNQNFSILKALFGEYHEEVSATAADRAGSVGRLGMAAGIAFMVGPLLSSTFLKTYNQSACFALFCLAGSALSVFLLPSPKTIPVEKSGAPKETKRPSSFLDRIIPDFVPAARTPAAVYIMVSRICMALSFHVFQTIWAVALRERFHFGPQDYGRYFGFIGFCFAFSQGVLAKLFLSRFGQSSQGRARLLMVCAVMLGGGRLLAYQTSNMAVVYVLFGGIVTALGVINTIFTADTSRIADPSELGGLFGVLASVESLAGITGPLLGGVLSKIHPTNGPLFAVVGLYGLVFSLAYWGYERIVGEGRSISSSKKNN